MHNIFKLGGILCKTSMKSFRLTFLLLLLIFSNCSPELKIKDYLDHWEITRSYDIYSNSKIDLDYLNSEYKVVGGTSCVLIIKIERQPIFKKGKELTDLYSSTSLIIEIDPNDSIVTTEIAKSKSKLFRQLFAFSPEGGIKELTNKDKIKLVRIRNNYWSINSEVRDFIFKANLDLTTNQNLSINYKEYE
jgi:hypothetical protein